MDEMTKSEIENTTREIHKVIAENKDLNTLQGQAEQNVSDTASKFNTVFTVVAVVAVIFLLVSTALTLIDISRTYDIDFFPIPKYIVDEVDIMAYNDKGERIFVNNQTAYYKVVTCNRVEGNSSIEKKHKEILVDKNDLNGDVGKQWLSLYAVKYENGCPILADSLLYRKGGGDMPDGYSTGIHEFGGKAATNLNNKKYLFAEDPPMIQVFFKNTTRTVSELMSTNTDASAGDGSGEAGAGKDGTDASLSTEKKDAGATGSIFEQSGTGFGLALGGGVGIALGAILGALLMYFSRRRKLAPVEDTDKET